MYVYKIINNFNNKIYVGKSIYSIDKSIDYYGSGVKIINAIKKYGKKNFKKEIIKECLTLQELNEQEIYWISELKSYKNDIGYNISMGGDGGDTISKHPNRQRIVEDKTKWSRQYWTPEKKIEQSIRYKGKGNPFSEKHHTEESIQKISTKKKGIHNSIDTNNKISDTLRIKYQSGEIVKIVTDETRNKLSKSHMGLGHTQITKDKLRNISMGAGNPSAKLWIFINKNGEQIEVNGEFQKFCIEHNLSYKAMRTIANNTRKDKYYNSWTVKKLN